MDIKDQSRWYLTFQQGYKGPGFNVFYIAATDTAPIVPEKSEAYELGYKLQSGGLLFNLAIFQTEFSGFQANTFDTSEGTTITHLTNAGDVITSGVEVDFYYQM